MAGAREVKRRIKSVENNRQITRTMELVATSKLKRLQTAYMQLARMQMRYKKLSVGSTHQSSPRSIPFFVALIR